MYHDDISSSRDTVGVAVVNYKMLREQQVAPYLDVMNRLEQLLDQQVAGDVIHSQRITHQAVTGETVADRHGRPAIELF